MTETDPESEIYSSHHFHQPLECTAKDCDRSIPVAVCISDEFPWDCRIPYVWRCSLHERRLDAENPAPCQ